MGGRKELCRQPQLKCGNTGAAIGQRCLSALKPTLWLPQTQEKRAAGSLDWTREVILMLVAIRLRRWAVPAVAVVLMKPVHCWVICEGQGQ